MVRARLVVVEPSDQQAVVYLDQPDLVLGRGLDTDILLMDDGASRHHARFERHDLGFSIIDLDSGNGTYVNGRKIESFDLFDGDIVVIGKSKIRFETVGWRRIPQPRASFVNSVLNTDQSARGGFGWSGLAIAFLFSFLTVMCIGLIKAPSGQDLESLIDDQLLRTQKKVDTGRLREAEVELSYAQVLTNLMGQKPTKLDSIAARLSDRMLIEDIEIKAKDGVAMSDLMKIGKGVSSNEEAQKELLFILNGVRNVRSDAHHQAAKRALDAGRADVALKQVNLALTYRPSDSDLRLLKKKIAEIKSP